MHLTSLPLSLKSFILNPIFSIKKQKPRVIFCFIILLLLSWLLRELSTLVSVQAWQTILSAFSAYSDTKWFVSVHFFKRAAVTISILQSRSFVGSSVYITWRVMHAFLATYDLKFSVYFTTFFMHSLGRKLPSVIDKSSLWN